MTRASALSPSPKTLVLATILWTGCGTSDEHAAGDAPSGPALVLVDSILLGEADSVYIGKPGKPHVDPYDGTFYIPDFFSNEVYRFARDGQIVRRYGRPGQGPGELGSVGAVIVGDDSTVHVVDRGNGKLVTFDRGTGRLRGERAIVGTPAQAAPLVMDDSIWLHRESADATADLMVFALSGDSSVSRGRRPGVFLASISHGGRYLRFYGSTGFLARADDRILHGYTSLNRIFVRDRSGTILDSVYIPAVRRRGVPADLQERMDIEKIDLLDAMELHSAVFDVHVLPSGIVAIDHQDWTLLNRRVPPATSARVWISLLSADLTLACVDSELVGATDAKPMEAFRGDTIFQLDRRVRGEEGSPESLRVETWLRIVRVDPSSCDWIPAEPPERERS